MESPIQSQLNMATSKPGCYLWQRETFPWRHVSSPIMHSFKYNRTVQHLLMQRKPHSIQHIPRSKPTHTYLQQMLKILSIVSGRKVFPQGSVWGSDCCFSVTNTLQCLSWQSWLEMTVCNMADGRGHDNQSVGPFLFCFFCLTPHCQIHAESLTEDVS